MHAAPEGYTVFHGSVHDHTSEGGDDGLGSVKDALGAARSEGFDFFAVTPHNHMIKEGAYASLQREIEESLEPRHFVPLAGMEWGSISKGGHIGVIGAQTLKKSEATDWGGFYRSVRSDPGSPLVILNHPKWNREFGGRPNADRIEIARLMEILGGPGHPDTDHLPTRCDFFHEEYLQVLNQGWRCGVAYGEDDHSGSWGRVAHTRMGIWAEELTLESVMESLHARRTFVTEDPDMSIWIELDGVAMGGDAPEGATRLKVEIKHDKADAVEIAVLLDSDGPGNDGAEEVHRGNGLSLEYTLESVRPGSYVMVLARDQEGDLCWSSPIWIGKSTIYLEPDGGDYGLAYTADLNFSSPDGLQRVRGIGKGTANRIDQARRNGIVFMKVEDLLEVEGISAETYELIAPHLKVTTGVQTLRYLAALDVRSSSFVLVADARQRLVMNSDRASRLLVAQVMDHLQSSDSAPAGQLIQSLLDENRIVPATRSRVLRLLRFLAKEEGMESQIGELIPNSTR